MKMNITEPMHIHSLDGAMREATIVEMVGENSYIAEYNGVRYPVKLCGRKLNITIIA